MNIRTAVHVIVIAVSLLVATLVFVLQSRSRESMVAIDEIHSQHVASVLKCSEFMAEVMLVSQWLHDVSATRAAPGFDDGWAESDAAMGRAVTIARDLEKLLVDPSDRQSLAATIAALPKFHEVGKRMARQYVEGGPAAGNAMMGEFDTAAEAVRGHAADLRTHLLSVLEHRLEQLEAAEANAVTWSNWIAAIALLGCAYTAFQLRRSVVRPLQSTITRIRDIADGRADLTQTLAVEGPGELRELAEAFNRVSERFRNLVREVADHASGLHSSTVDMTSSAESMAQRASDTHGRAAVVASAAEELSITMSQLTKETTELSQQLDQIVGATARIDTSVQQVSTSTDRTATVAGQAAQLAESGIERISRLTTAADAIGKVVATIQDIAEQTNLLALNATIEAARAGESGKGFAVVATEVKTLANQTATSTDEIRDQVVGIQRSSHDVDDSINSVVSVVQEAYTLSKSAAEAVIEQRQELASITSMVHDVANTLRTVMSAIGQSAQASQEIAQTISEVDNDSRDFQARSSAMLVSIESVSDKSSQLSNLAGQFMHR